MTSSSKALADRKAAPAALRVADAAGMLIDKGAITISIASIVAIFLALMAEVVMRYFTSAGLGWPNEIPNLLFPWLVMGGIVVGAQRGAHIASEAFRSFLNDMQLRFLMAGINILVAVSFSYLAYLALQVIVITKAQTFPITNLGQAWAYSALLFGFGGIALSCVVNLVRVALCDDPRVLHQTEQEHMT